MHPVMYICCCHASKIITYQLQLHLFISILRILSIFVFYALLCFKYQFRKEEGARPQPSTAQLPLKSRWRLNP